MVVYNITIQVNWSIHDKWLPWMQTIHIPEVLSTGKFSHHSMLKLLDMDETEGPTYAIQFFAADRNEYEDYITQHAPLLRQKTQSLWNDQIHAFRTLMEVVN